MEAQRDQNFRTTVIGVSSEDGVTPVPFRVDPVTGRLLIQVVDQSAISPITPQTVAQRDQNHVPVSMAYNGDDPQSLVTHDNYLLVNFD